MEKNTQPSDNKQAKNSTKGVRKVNLADIQGKLNKRGRERFHDDELAEALRESMKDGESFIWETAVVTGKTDKAVNASKAKWRSRAVSVFNGLGFNGYAVRVQWTQDNEMLVTVYTPSE